MKKDNGLNVNHTVTCDKFIVVVSADEDEAKAFLG